MRKALLAAALCAVTLVAVAKRDPVTLVWKPVVGAVHEYTFKSTADDVQGQPVKISALMKETVKNIMTNGNVVVEQDQSSFSVLYGTKDISDTPGIPQAIKITMVNAPNGSLISQTSDTPGSDSQRTDYLGQFVMPDHPVNVGDTWSYTGKADPKKGIYDYEINYTYQGTETVDGVNANKVAVTFGEKNVPAGTTAMTGTGAIWLDPADGELVKMAVKLQNADMGVMGTANVDLTIDKK